MVLGLWMFAGTPSSWAQIRVPGNVSAAPERQGNVVTVRTEHAVVRLEFCGPAMVRVRARFDGPFRPDEHIMVMQHSWPVVDLRIRDLGGLLDITTSRLNVRVHRTPFRL